MTQGRPRSASNFLAGATSGFVTTLLLQPLDVAKTRMQMSTAFSKAIGIESQLRIAPNSGISATISAVARYDGMRGLWRGVLPTILRNMLGVGLYFVTLNNVTAMLRSKDGTLSNSATLLAGASARSLSATMLCPLSVIKTRFEAFELGGRYTGVFNALVKISSTEGVAGLFAGLIPTIVRDAPYAALYLIMYLRTKDLVKSFISTDGSTVKGGVGRVVNFSAGIFSGGMATLMTQPQDVVKTRMQLSRHKPGRKDKYNSVWTTVRRVFQEEGLYGFFRGSSPRFAKRCLGSAITWTIYEETVYFYEKMLVRQSGEHLDAQTTSS